MSDIAEEPRRVSGDARGEQPAARPSVAPQERELSARDGAFHARPRGSIEYKYRLDKGKALLYSWKATGPVNYELHAEPDGAPQGYAESYEKKDAQSRRVAGTLTAPFAGIHGWYWENPARRR